MDIAQNLIDATCEIFDTMLMMPVVPEPDNLAATRQHFSPGVTGMVGLAGAYKGMLAIHVSESVAKTITGSFLGIEVDDINDDVRDAMGEMANMLAGSVKAALGAGGQEIKLSIPSAVCGVEYTLDCPGHASGVMMPFTIEAGPFLVELRLEEQT